MFSNLVNLDKSSLESASNRQSNRDNQERNENPFTSPFEDSDLKFNQNASDDSPMSGDPVRVQEMPSTSGSTPPEFPSSHHQQQLRQHHHHHQQQHSHQHQNKNQERTEPTSATDVRSKTKDNKERNEAQKRSENSIPRNCVEQETQNESFSLHSQAARLPYNWQLGIQNIKDRLAALYNNETMSDINFIVGKEPNLARLPAHKFVLSIGSPVFYAMFNGN